jgi:hypothetical protein
MATSTNPGPAQQPTPPEPTPRPTPGQPAPPPRPTPQPTTDPNAPPPPPTPTQEEADAIKSGEYDPSAPEGQRVKRKTEETKTVTEERRSMEADTGPRYTTR